MIYLSHTWRLQFRDSPLSCTGMKKDFSDRINTHLLSLGVVTSGHSPFFTYRIIDYGQLIIGALPPDL